MLISCLLRLCRLFSEPSITTYPFSRISHSLSVLRVNQRHGGTGLSTFRRTDQSGKSSSYSDRNSADVFSRSDLFQHRLPLPSPNNLAAVNKWQTVHIPLSSFVLTNSGALSETQITMLKSKVRTVGLSILGSERVQESAATSDEEGLEGSHTALQEAGPGVEGKFELGIRKIEAVRRDEDAL
jgi:hypothetical protein